MGSNNFSNSWQNYANLKLLVLILLPSFLLVSACSDLSSPADVSEELSGSVMDNERAKKGLPEGVVYNEFNRNYYMPVATAGLTWDEASEAASSMRAIKGCQPHLATVTSANEQGWIASTFPEAITGGYWLGGKQAPGTADPFAEWGWITGETWLYTNWNGISGEPNDFGGIEEESLQFIPAVYDGGGTGGWNDAATDGTGFFDIDGNFVSGVDGYLVEWDCKLIVTGGGGTEGHLGFNAQKATDTRVKGQAEVGFINGERVHISVSCVSVWGNEAWIGGITTQSTNDLYPVGTPWIWSIADNGQGNSSEPDATSFFVYSSLNPDFDQNCALQFDEGIYATQFEWENGNLVVH